MPVIGFGAAIGFAKRQTGARVDPFGAYNFHVEIDGMIVGGFSEVSGLSMETKIKRVREGGTNDFEHAFVEGTTSPDLLLKRGMSDVDALLGWYHDVIRGRIRRKNGTIYLQGKNGAVLTWWDFKEAIPFKWEGPALNAESGAIATESISLAHHGLTRGKQPQAAAVLRRPGF